MSIWVIVPIPKRVTCRFHTAPCFCWGNYSWDHFRFSLMTKSCADLYWRQMYVVKVVSSWTKLVEGMQDLRLTSARSTWNQSYVRTQICIPDCSTNRIYRVTTYKPKSLSSMSVYFLHIHAHAMMICSDGMKNNILPSAMCCCSWPGWEQTIDQMTQGENKKQGREGSHDCRRCCLRKYNSATRHIFTVVTSSCALFLDLRKQKDDTTS